MKLATTNILLCRQEPVLRKKILELNLVDELADLSDYLQNAESGFRRTVRDDLASHGILCGPEIKYDGTSLEGTITHGNGTTKKLVVPYFHEAKIEDALENDWRDKRNLTYLQNLTSMYTSGEEIIRALVELGGRSREHIRLQTMMPGDRKNYDSACTAMFLENGKFIIGNNKSLKFNAGTCYVNPGSTNLP